MALLSPTGSQYFHNDNTEAALGLLHTYVTGTTTPLAAYQDQAGTAPHTNPIVLDSAGRVQPQLWLNDTNEYRIRLETAAGVLVDEWDDIYGIGGAGAASLLAVDLLNFSDPTKGSGQVGYLPTLAYAANTAGAKLRYVGQARALESFAPAMHNDGATDDSATFQAAAASGFAVIDARGLNCRIASTINIPNGQTWLLQGTSINFTGSTLTVFAAAAVHDWALLGPFTITGGAATIGTARGIYIKDCSNYYIDRPVLRSIQGWGILLDPDVSTSIRSQHGVINNPRVDSCYYGWEDIAGTGAEYTTIHDPYITRCTSFGLKTCAGNILVIGGHIVDNVALGVWLGAGANHGHGIFTGTQINHNGTYGIQATQVLNGHTFIGCHIYQNDVWFDRCKGIQIYGGHVDPTSIYNYKDGSSGMNKISGAYFPGTYGPKRTVGSNDGHDQLIIDDTNWGPGTYAIAGGKDTAGLSIKDPSTCYVHTIRDATATQSLTSGVAATITWSTENYLYDRRGVQSAGTFTIPADQAGLYHVDFNALFSGTAMSTTASFVEMKIGGVTKKVMLPTITSTTTLQVQGSFNYYFNGSDAVTFVATITGTTPVFGNATWPSDLALRRIA